METFDAFLFLIAKLGFALFVLVILLRLVCIPFLWLWYDKPIERLIDELENFKHKIREGAGGRGMTTGVVDGHIQSKERKIMEEVKVLQLKRQHLLDRVNLFLTISSLGK